MDDNKTDARISLVAQDVRKNIKNGYVYGKKVDPDSDNVDVLIAAAYLYGMSVAQQHAIQTLKIIADFETDKE